LPLAALATASVAYGVSSYFVRLDYNGHLPLGRRGFHQSELSRDGLALLNMTVARTSADSLVYVLKPEMALELTGAGSKAVRVIVSGEGEGELHRRTYKGRVPRLLVFVDDRHLADQRGDVVLKSFLDYDPARWAVTRSGDTAVFAQPSL
jgi:hypothetical protein